MKHFYSVLFILTFLPGICSAQFLTDNNAPTGPLLSSEVTSSASSPEWENDGDRVYGHISGSKLMSMRSVNASLISYFHDSCMSESLYGSTWHGEYFSEKAGSGPVMKFGVECDFNDQKARLTMMANDLSPLLDHLLVNNQDFLTIRPTFSAKNECPYFEYALDTQDDAPMRSKTWLVTVGNSPMPYIPVSRKEYLTEARAELTAIKANIVADMKQRMPMRSLAVQEADKKAALDQLASLYSGMDLQIRTKMFLQNYQTDEEYQRQTIDRETIALTHTLHLMDSLLISLPADQLAKPAIVSVQAADFTGFEDGRGDKMLIHVNAAWLNAGLGGEKPRFFLISWQYSPSAPAADDLGKQIQEKFNGKKLKAMLDKQ
ncbi:MAG: hypothetical protein Q8927_02530 [Bacteroidota bacterium]|nr:hypothetical protein [Bacteroidota bacterium]MDP4244280.1 hypothetical protein [Bacteroidota bacterium]MDP4252790.1 hypothetical protein [Bacteroidota bacterium]MDP4257525.1 hypothetical protein [Bacteroidota bacterium]